jgi:NADH-quinone oxidoreductase subunit G
MRVWFLDETESVCPGCSTGCNIFIDHRDGEAQRLRPRRNAEVNKSWMCDPGRALYEEIGASTRLSRARLREASSWRETGLAEALDLVAGRLEQAGEAVACVASPQATNEDLFALRTLAEARGSLLDFRVGDPQERLKLREDEILQRADKNPNTQGCLDAGLGRSGLPKILEACRGGDVQVLLLQGPELLLDEGAAEALGKVPCVVVMATHAGPELERAHVVLPVAAWAEVEGTFTNFARRVQRIRPAFPPPGEARPRWEIAAELLRRLGAPLTAATPREVFGLLAQTTHDYAALDYGALGGGGRALPTEGKADA